MSDPCLIEVIEHQSTTAAAEVIASEAATWLGYCVFSGSATVALPGRAAPERLLQHLADVPIAWDRVTVTTTDEYLLPESHRLSASGHVRRAFGKRCGSQARIVSLGSPDALTLVSLPLDLVVLVMAEDGTVACLPACASSNVSSTPLTEFWSRPSVIEAPVASRRLNSSVLASCKRTLFVCAGTSNRNRLERAFQQREGGPLEAWFRQAQGLVTVHWAEK